jgi:hypothetical protein
MIIGLSGYARSGKDEVAKILVEDYGYQRIAFADKIRDFLLEVNPQIRDGFRIESVVNAYGWDEAKVLFPEVRKLLQDVGVAARIVFGDEFWINEAFKTLDPADNIVITDVRFTNEADQIKLFCKFTGQDSLIWRIKREGVQAVNNHISEHNMDGYPVDQILKNEGTLENLRAVVRDRIEFSLNAN